MEGVCPRLLLPGCAAISGAAVHDLPALNKKRGAATMEPGIAYASGVRCCITLLIALSVSATCCATTGRAEMAREMDRMLSGLYPPDEPGAAVLVAKDGAVIFRKGYGLANVEHSVPITPDTVFRIASMTKQFTAVSILMLVEQGRLDLDDSIAKYLPGYPQGERITIRQLLTHTSGVWDYCGLDEVRRGMRRDITVDELIDLFKDKPLDFQPGEKMAYSNSGYVLLGAIIEKVSGRSYAEFLQDNIFAKAGMHSSTTDEQGKIIRNRAAGYVRVDGELQNAPFISMTEPFACGNIVSSVNDLFRWNEALFNGLLKPQTLALAFTPARLNDGTLTDSACGFGLSQIKGRRAVIHPGHIHGFYGYGLMVPAERLYVVWLSNRPPPGPRQPSDLVAELAAIAMNDPYVKRAAVELPDELLDAYAGVYVAPEDGSIVGGGERLLEHKGDALYLHMFGKQFEAVPVSQSEFYLKERFPVSFVIRDGTDGSTHLELDWPLGVNQTLWKKEGRDPKRVIAP
jgi:CubicO group peptidase (beta-lactamase class C family)